jgi:hypothetical protein
LTRSAEMLRDNLRRLAPVSVCCKRNILLVDVQVFDWPRGKTSSLPLLWRPRLAATLCGIARSPKPTNVRITTAYTVGLLIQIAMDDETTRFQQAL